MTDAADTMIKLITVGVGARIIKQSLAYPKKKKKKKKGKIELF